MPKNKLMKKVVVFGVFDLLHPGHLYFLKQAKSHGNHLTVIVTRDARVKSEKKRTPFFSEQERLEMVQALQVVDKAVLGDRVGEWTINKLVKTDVICIGYDQNAGLIKKSNFDPKLKVVRIKPWRVQKYTSTNLRKHLRIW